MDKIAAHGTRVVRGMALSALIVLICGFWGASSARAQDQMAAPAAETENKVLGLTEAAGVLDENKEAPEVKILKSIEKEMREKNKKEVYERSTIPSLIFTPSQHALLREARIGFNTRLPTLQELRDPGDPNDPNYRPPVALREIKLGGIAFSSPDEWTIWLNNARVTPDALPAEALDIRVYREFIELKWFDSATNQVFPIRLRTNQKFNLDTRIFLPG